MYTKAIIGFAIALIVTLFITPLVIKLAFKLGVVDKPNGRKVHSNVMPRMGGLAIFIGVVAGFFASGLYEQRMLSIALGAIVIVITGLIDDKYELSAKVKLFAQIFAAIIVIRSDLTVDILAIPFVGVVELGWWSYLVTVIWIVAITNAINLIDGLDGLAAGVAAIGIATIAGMAFLNEKVLIFALCMLLLGSTLGFLFHNFYPAKIFMGDTGSMFLGYSIAIVTLLGMYKSVALFSVIVPITLLGVPVFDTLMAILRRVKNKRPISAPDKGHLHHRLLDLGLSQRQTVLVIYACGVLFGIGAILLSNASIVGVIIGVIGILLGAQLLAEFLKLIHAEYRPLIKVAKKLATRAKAMKRGN